MTTLLDTAVQLSPPNGLRPLTCLTIFGLLATSGLRISEALNLTRADADLKSGVLNIQEGKFHKSRLVPLHQTTVDKLIWYAINRDEKLLKPTSDRFFLRDDGQPANQPGLLYALQALCHQLNWSPRGDHLHHRLHDFRHTAHTFIVHSLLRFYQHNIDIDRAILSLSTYVGHARVSDTYWYFTGVPELMSIVAQRFQHYAQETHQ
ncbi:tyrosine-type recombinase/integrase [Crocosphaera sp.]|uniref:tyrosine-type recombinase/integrase n=1 Tax=Crocosphaera sp. TaxID=2729996 RepID=UPI002579FFB8|nr:tyrosine-type recombinase/integrase [Crocosphaera sp.]